MPMDHISLIILHDHLQRLIEGSMDQTPDMFNIAAKCIHMLPETLDALLRWIRPNVVVHALPVLHLPVNRHAQLERARRIFVGSAPEALDHNRWRVANAISEDLAGKPAGGVGWIAPEELHLASFHDSDDVKIPEGANVGRNEGGAALQDVGGDCTLVAY
jgi:hypothetical protein